MSGTHICQTCGRTCYPKTITKGSIFIEIILWLTFLLPGLIYTIWRHTSRYKGCSFCGSASLVPIDSPHGRAIVESRSEKTQNRACPHCGEEIKKIAKLCKHCKSPVEPIYVDDPEANRQIVLIGQLRTSGLSSEQIVQELKRRQVQCLVHGEDWNTALVSRLINDFALAYA